MSTWPLWEDLPQSLIESLKPFKITSLEILKGIPPEKLKELLQLKSWSEEDVFAQEEK